MNSCHFYFIELSRCFSASITFHNLENRPKQVWKKTISSSQFRQDGICIDNLEIIISIIFKISSGWDLRCKPHVANRCRHPLHRQILCTGQKHHQHRHHQPLTFVVIIYHHNHQVGQSHGGFLGLVQKSLSRAAAHIWFQVTCWSFCILYLCLYFSLFCILPFSIYFFYWRTHCGFRSLPWGW